MLSFKTAFILISLAVCYSAAEDCAATTQNCNLRVSRHQSCKEWGDKVFYDDVTERCCTLGEIFQSEKGGPKYCRSAKRYPKDADYSKDFSYCVKNREFLNVDCFAGLNKDQCNSPPHSPSRGRDILDYFLDGLGGLGGIGGGKDDTLSDDTPDDDTSDDDPIGDLPDGYTPDNDFSRFFSPDNDNPDDDTPDEP